MALSHRDRDFDIRQKSMLAAYMMWFFLPGLAAHRFYLGRPLSAIAMIALWVGGLAVIFVSLSNARHDPSIVSGGLAAIPFFVIYGAWHLIDVALIPSMLAHSNGLILKPEG